MKRLLPLLVFSSLVNAAKPGEHTISWVAPTKRVDGTYWVLSSRPSNGTLAISLTNRQLVTE